METNQPGWIELAVEAEPEAVEAITELFARYGYNQGVVIEEKIKPGPDGGAEVDPAGLVSIRTYLPDAGTVLNPLPSSTPGERRESAPEEKEPGLSQAESIQKLRQGLFYLGMMRRVGELKISRHREEDWANSWKEFYQVHRIGNRTVIKPPWQPYEPSGNELVVEIDPGMAFGTGLHPTTRLCLTLLEDRLKPGEHRNVLDLGTGSGILAIAAGKLGAEKVVAVDTDQVAVLAARENVARNNLAGRVELEVGSLAVEPGVQAGSGFYSFSPEAQQQPAILTAALPFDAVVANIIARIIVALARPMANALRPGGLLITSGIIADKAAEVEAALEKAGLDLLERRQEGDWIAYAHQRNRL